MISIFKKTFIPGLLLLLIVEGIKNKPFLFQAFWYPHLFLRGGQAKPPQLSQKPLPPINVKFCRILETPLKVLEMLKLFT